MRKHGILGAGLALALWASPAAADTIWFDANGGAAGGFLEATVFDWAPGNSLIIENSPTSATILYQANLNVVQDASGSGFLNGSLGAGSWFTAVAEFDVTLIPGVPGSTTYTVNPGSGTLRIYADNERGNNLSGLGFALDPGAIEILEATVTAGNGSFAFNLLAPTEDLDSFLSGIGGAVPEAAGNNYPGVQTLRGTGAADVIASVVSFDSSYFLNLAAGTTVAFTNASQIDPYNQANPSEVFSIDGVTNGGTTGVGSVGPVNGLGLNIIAQSDANTEFVGAVPEPATLTLLGLGLAGSAAARRRQRKAAAAKQQA